MNTKTQYGYLNSASPVREAIQGFRTSSNIFHFDIPSQTQKTHNLSPQKKK